MIEKIKSLKEKGSPENDMDMKKSASGMYDLIDKLCTEYTQEKPSRMDADIMTALKCDAKKARYLAVRACKVFCFWLELYTKGMLEMSFAKFFEYGVKGSMIDAENCNMMKTQIDILKIIKTQGHIKGAKMDEVNNLEKFKVYNLEENWTGTIRIETGKDKYHSIPCYNMNGEIKLSDISYRGKRVDPFKKYITAANFRYMTSIKEN
jgi:hypothetical protein